MCNITVDTNDSVGGVDTTTIIAVFVVIVVVLVVAITTLAVTALVVCRKVKSSKYDHFN